MCGNCWFKAMLTLDQAKSKAVNYAESDSEGADSIDEEVFKPRSRKSRARPTKKRRVSDSGDEDNYKEESDGAEDEGERLRKVPDFSD